MPRKGRFGRHRTGSSNLTALITQLVQQQRAAEDKAIFDAYQNGGLFQGKPVDDKRILAYITQRRDGFSKDDPLYDQWNNNLIQTRFSIGEQKIGLAFKQGKVGAGAVAAYYRSQLSHIPKDSAFYRDVAGRAAQWAKSASSAAHGSARGRATKGLRDKLNASIYKSANFEALERALTDYAKREGIIAGNQTLTDASAGAIEDLFARGIYVGKDQLTFDEFKQAVQDNYKALSNQVDLQVKLGNQGVTARNKRDKFLEQSVVRWNAMDDRAQYEAARDSWLDNVAAAKGDPYAVAKANEAYVKALSGIHSNALTPTGKDANDPEFIGGLVNEINAVATGKSTGPTVADLMSNTGEGVVTHDADETAQGVAALQTDLDNLSSGKAYYGQTEPGGDYKVVLWPPGGPNQYDQSLQPSLTTVNGETRVVYQQGQKVTASLITKDGVPIDQTQYTPDQIRAGLSTGELDATEGNTLGYVYQAPGSNVKKYGVIDKASGQMLFTYQNPWSSDPVQSGDGLTVFTTNGTNIGSQTDPRYVANTDAIMNGPVSLANADPLLSDTTVAPADLMRLAQQGIKGFSPEDVQQYADRLKADQQRKAAESAAEVQQRADERLSRVPTINTGNQPFGSDLGAAAQQVRDVTQQVQAAFAGKQADDLYQPPPPPKPPVVAAVPDVSKPDTSDPSHIPGSGLGSPEDLGISVPNAKPGSEPNTNYKPPKPPKIDGSGSHAGSQLS